MFDTQNIHDLLGSHVIPWIINIALALAIFYIGRKIAAALSRLLGRMLEKSGTDQMLVGFVVSVSNAVFSLFVIIAALNQLGIDTTSLIALIGAAGLAIGLALQGSLQNFAAGVLLILFRPFKVGDMIEAGGASGSVQEIGLLSTVLKTGDNRIIILPNGSIYDGKIVNNSARETRRIDMVFGIGYEDDLRKAKDILQSILEADERILKEPAPLVAVGELGDSSVNFNVRPWVKASDYWKVRYDLNERVKLAFDEAGISIPYPQMDVHLKQE